MREVDIKKSKIKYLKKIRRLWEAFFIALSAVIVAVAILSCFIIPDFNAIIGVIVGLVAAISIFGCYCAYRHTYAQIKNFYDAKYTRLYLEELAAKYLDDIHIASPIYYVDEYDIADSKKKDSLEETLRHIERQREEGIITEDEFRKRVEASLKNAYDDDAN